MTDAGVQQTTRRGIELRLPDAYVVGHPKSGTTAMYEMLFQHPQIFLGRKEPRYFASEMHHRDTPRPGGTPKTLEEYELWFREARPEQLIVDVSPWYLWSRSAASLIAGARPDARIIAVLREPASFLSSLHRQWLQLNVESEVDFRKAIALEQARRQGREIPVNTYWPKALLYSDFVRYAEQLRRYHAVFPREQVLVLIYDDFRADNEETMRKVLRFVGVDDTLPLVLRESNPSVQVRAKRLHGLMRALSVANDPASRMVKRSIKQITPGRARHRVQRVIRRRVVFGRPRPTDQELMVELRHRFKPEVEAVSEYLGRDLVAQWGYDRLD
jgi:Sulfotransferase family